MTQTEIDFERLTSQLVIAGERGDREAFNLLCDEVPGIVSQIQTDSRRNGPLSFWGRSTNHDEIADQTIVPPLMIRLLARITGKKLSELTPNAGLQHCYGYLFSNLETPYGFKRQRWIETGLEEAFGLDLTTLGPRPLGGTLLSNATYFSGLVAFRGYRQQMDRLKRLLKRKVSVDLAGLKTRSFEHFRLNERVKRSWRGREIVRSLQTDVIRSQCGYKALIYSVRYHDDRHELVTLFPIDQSTWDSIRERASGDVSALIRPRYNAHIPGLTGQTLAGRISSRVF